MQAGRSEVVVIDTIGYIALLPGKSITVHCTTLMYSDSLEILLEDRQKTLTVYNETNKDHEEWTRRTTVRSTHPAGS